MSHLSSLLKVFAHDLSSSSKLSRGEATPTYPPPHPHVHTHTPTPTPTELKQQLAVLVRALNTECPAEMQAASAGLTPSELHTLTSALTA